MVVWRIRSSATALRPLENPCHLNGTNRGQFPRMATAACTSGSKRAASNHSSRIRSPPDLLVPLDRSGLLCAQLELRQIPTAVASKLICMSQNSTNGAPAQPIPIGGHWQGSGASDLPRRHICNSNIEHYIGVVRRDVRKHSIAAWVRPARKGFHKSLCFPSIDALADQCSAARDHQSPSSTNRQELRNSRTVM
jgi:hypothetical protein